MRRSRPRALAASVVGAFAVVGLPGLTSAASPSVSVFPIPGSSVASPQAQITFRGLPPGELGQIKVTGSQSGDHPGEVRAHSDGGGGSFIPSQPFTPGETVTVNTDLKLQGSVQGSFQFGVASPAGPLPSVHWHVVPRVRGGVMRFRSRPDLVPPAAKLIRRGATAAGDIFLGAQGGPFQQGPMILDGKGELVWFKHLSGNDSAMDFRAQTYRGKPVLTWWQGNLTAGVGRGSDVIYSRSYEPLARVQAGNGLIADLHEFKLTAQNTALITAYYPIYVDATAVRGSRRQIVLDSVVQEIDVPTGLVLFQWDSLDHVPLRDSFQHLPPRNTRQPYDYFHVNSIEPDSDGSLIISGRNAWTAYKVDHGNGRVIWRLGGKHSSFKIARGASFAFQHDVRSYRGDSVVTLIDNGAGDYAVHKQTRALKLRLDLRRRTARREAEHDHDPSLLSIAKGNYQRLKGGGAFIGWGATPFFATEYDAHASLVLDARFVGLNASYRAFRLPWGATPAQKPAIAASSANAQTTVYASWNGATGVQFWRVRGGARADRLRGLSTVRKQGFETAITVPGSRFVEIQALGARRRVLAVSKVLRT